MVMEKFNDLNMLGKVIVCGVEIPHIYGGFGPDKKSILAKHIAEIHGKKLMHVNEAINNNRKYFKDGIDVIDLKGTEFVIDLVDNGIMTQNAVNRAENIYLLSERGYAKLLKIFNDNLAWEKYDQLLDEYFQMRETKSKVVPLSKDQALVTVLRTTADLVEENQEIKKRINELEHKIDEHITLNSGEQRKLQKEIAKRVYELADQLANKQLGFSSDEEIVPDVSKERRRLFQEIHRDIKDRFAVASYKDIRRAEFREVLAFVQAWRPRLVA